MIYYLIYKSRKYSLHFINLDLENTKNNWKKDYLHIEYNKIFIWYFAFYVLIQYGCRNLNLCYTYNGF